MERSNTLKAAAWMMGAVVSFTAMAVAGREIQVEMNTFELMLYRSAIGFAVVLLVLPRSARRLRPGAQPPHLGLHLKRNLFHYTGQNLWFYAVALIPLSQLVALEFTNPIWVALLAPFLLGERLTRVRILAALIGFIGVLDRRRSPESPRSSSATPPPWSPRSALRSTPSSPSRSCASTACFACCSG